MAEEVQGQAAEESESAESSEATIAVHWREEGVLPCRRPSSSARPTPRTQRFSTGSRKRTSPSVSGNTRTCCHWDKYWHTTLDTSNPPFWRWFIGGKLNASYNCVDRHLEKHKNKAALIWVPEPEDAPHVVITYQELYRQVNEFAALLRDFCGVKAGDRVTLHMPMVPELPVVMLACARLGVIHSQVFGGFSGARLRAPHRRLRQQDPHHDGRLLPQRRRARPQGQGRRGGRGGPQGGHRGREGAGLAALPGPVLLQDADGGGPGLLRRRGPRRLPGSRSSRRCPCRPRRRCS